MVRLTPPEDKADSAAPGIVKFNIYFGGKALFSIPNERIAPTAPVKAVFILKPGIGATVSAEWRDRLKFAFEVVFGVGLIQMWEYFLRLDNLVSLFAIFRQRIKLAVLLLRFNPVCITSRRPVEELTATLEHGIIQ